MEVTIAARAMMPDYRRPSSIAGVDDSTNLPAIGRVASVGDRLRIVHTGLAKGSVQEGGPAL